jgi:hypothetical protein
MGAVLDKERVVREEDLSSYLTAENARNTYVVKPADDSYVLQKFADRTYLKIPSNDEYLLKSSANNLYQPRSNYVSLEDFNTYKSTADGLYQPKGNYQISGDYLTKPITDGLYQPKGDYLTKPITDGLYQPKGDYLTKSITDGLYQPKIVGNLIIPGRVGVGTNNPNNILQVGNGGRLRIANSDSDYTLIGTSDSDGSSNPRLVLSGVTRGYNNGGMEYVGVNAGNHIFYTTSPGAANPTEKMRMTTDGRLGIGTLNPTSRLDVNGNIIAGQSLLGTWGAGGGSFSYFGNKNVTNTSQYGIIQLNNGDTYISGNNFVKIGPNNNQALTVDNSGNLCIGTTCINSTQLATMKSKLGI